MYIPPNGNIGDFFNYLASLLNTLHSENKQCFLFRDFNINFPAINGNVPSEFFHLLASYNTLSLINKPTGINSYNTTSVNINIFTNCLSCKSYILVTALSDNFAVLVHLPRKLNNIAILLQLLSI